MSRPRGSFGEIAARALELASAGPVHMFHLAETLQISRRDASVALYNLRKAEAVVVVDSVSHPKARKPIPRVQAAPPATVEDKLAALAAWPARRSLGA